MIPVDALTDYADHAVDALTGIVTSLGDDLANQRPDLPGANPPYAARGAPCCTWWKSSTSTSARPS